MIEFEWDLKKEQINLKKHQVSFLDAQESFHDPLGFSLEDVMHSKDEKRFYWIGKDKGDRVLTTWYTRRASVIRIIGCAELRRYRRLYYEITQIK